MTDNKGFLPIPRMIGLDGQKWYANLGSQGFGFRLWGRVLLPAVRVASSANFVRKPPYNCPNSPGCKRRLSRRHQLADSGVDQIGQ